VLKLNLCAIADRDYEGCVLKDLLTTVTGESVNTILTQLEQTRHECEKQIDQLTTVSADFIGDGYMTEKINKTRDEAAELSSACRQIISELKKFDTRKYQTNKLSKAYINELYKSVMNRKTNKFPSINENIAYSDTHGIFVEKE
jgi:hypothetical protein